MIKYTSKIADIQQLTLCLTFRKIYNLFLLRISFIISSVLKSKFHKGLPVSISIEPTTHCNLSCIECPSGNKIFSRPVGKINIAFFTQTINNLYKNLIYLTLYFQGEPFLHPDFFELVKIARKKNIYVATSTNAHFLTVENAKLTIESGLNRLIISLDGTNAETYLKYRKGGDFNKVINGINILTETKRKNKAHHLYIILQFIVFSSNENQISEVKRLGKSLGVDEVQIKTAQIYDYKNGNSLIPENEKYSRYKKISDTEFILKKRIKNKCLRMWQSAVITWDGKVVPCCFDKDANYLMGELKTQNFNEIWKSKIYNQLRTRIIQNRKSIDICCNCSE